MASTLQKEDSSSASKARGGGVLLDLSHEIDYLNWILPDTKYSYFFKKKLSSLKINAEDIAIINGEGKNKLQIQVNLNYFSRLFGSNETLPIGLSIWWPHLILLLICSLVMVRINEL